MTPQTRADVLDVLARFAHGIDGRDWALYRSVFADEVLVDYSSYRPGPVQALAADAWVDRARRLFPGLGATSHLLVNPWLTGDDDEVTVRTSMRADHVTGAERYTLGGTYVHRLRRSGEGDWRITAVTLTVTWREGDPALLTRAAAAVAGQGTAPPSTPST